MDCSSSKKKRLAVLYRQTLWAVWKRRFQFGTFRYRGWYWKKQSTFYTIANLQIFKTFYNTLCNMVGDNLQEMILNSAMQFRDAINRHLQLNWWFFLDFAESNSKEIMKAFDYFFHINGRFPVDEELKTLYKAKLPNFIHSNKAISPIYLYEKFRDSKFHVLLCTHCFCALNIHFGNNPELSWNEMNDFFHKTSMQPTAKSNSDVLVNFDKIPDSLTNINYLLQQKTYGFKMDEQ